MIKGADHQLSYPSAAIFPAFIDLLAGIVVSVIDYIHYSTHTWACSNALNIKSRFLKRQCIKIQELECTHLFINK